MTGSASSTTSRKTRCFLVGPFASLESTSLLPPCPSSFHPYLRLTSQRTATSSVIQLRKAIFARFPERKDECFERRAAYLASAIDEYDSGFSFLDIVDVMDRLSAILSWQSGEEDTGVLVRRGILRWRLRNLAGAKNDLLRALELSPTLPIHHLLALVHFELRHFDEAMTSVEQALARDGRDSIACAIRSQIHSFYGRISAATRDAEAASHSVNSEGTDDQSSRVTKTTYSPHPNRTFPDSPLPEFPDLPNLLAGFAWLT